MPEWAAGLQVRDKVPSNGESILNSVCLLLGPFRCRSVWNRWCTILETNGYAGRDAQTQAEIERCIEIAHAAPGASGGSTERRSR